MIEEVPLYQKPLKPRKRLVRKSLTRKPRKRARAKAKPLKRLRKDLWELCKQITRLKYGNTCYTCDAKDLSGGNWHTAHFVARSICGLHLRYDLRNLRPGCYRCNISLSGNGAEFYRRLVKSEGQEYVDSIFADKNRETKETVGFYTEKIASYQQLLASLET